MGKRSTSKRFLRCLGCDRQIRRKFSALVAHAKQCGNILACSDCRYLYRDSHRGMTHHAKKCEKGKEELRIALTCPLCERMFSSFHNLNTHNTISNIHTKPDIPEEKLEEHPCQGCGLILFSASIRRGHIVGCEKYKIWREQGGVRISDTDVWKRESNKRIQEKRRNRKKVLGKTYPLTYSHKIIFKQVITNKLYKGKSLKFSKFYEVLTTTILPLSFLGTKTVLEVDNENDLLYNNYVAKMNRVNNILANGWRVLFLKEETFFFQTEECIHDVIKLAEDLSWTGVIEL